MLLRKPLTSEIFRAEQGGDNEQHRENLAVSGDGRAPMPSGAMRLYVCWGTFQIRGARSHPCRNAYLALEEAGHQPELVKVHGFGALPNLTRGRREVKRITGQSWVPVLATDDGEVIRDSEQIIAWAEQHPAISA
jgi:hypothetical protein